MHTANDLHLEGNVKQAKVEALCMNLGPCICVWICTKRALSVTAQYNFDIRTNPHFFSRKEPCIGQVVGFRGR